MDKSLDLNPQPLLPRSLASFISVAHSDMRTARERKLTSLLLWASGFSVLFGSFPTPYRATFLAVGFLIPTLVLVSSVLHFHISEISGGENNVGHLFRFLNYRRAKEGLDAVIGTDMLTTLEVEAQIWEQIESALQSELWKSQPDLRDRIQRSADYSMIELIALGTSSTAKTEYRSWYDGWDTNAQRLRGLLMGVKQTERLLLAYQRPTDLSAETPIPETSEMVVFENFLID